MRSIRWPSTFDTPRNIFILSVGFSETSCVHGLPISSAAEMGESGAGNQAATGFVRVVNRLEGFATPTCRYRSGYNREHLAGLSALRMSLSFMPAAMARWASS